MIDELIEELMLTIELQQAHIEHLNSLLAESMDVVYMLDEMSPGVPLALLYADCRN